MSLLRRSLAVAPAGILLNRQQAHPALLRMLSRARRHRTPLLLVHIGPPDDASTAAQLGHQRFLEHLAAGLRIGDLTWMEPGGAVMLLLEDAPGGAAPIVNRLQRHAQRHGVHCGWRSARFPEQGLTLEALLEGVEWAA